MEWSLYVTARRLGSGVYYVRVNRLRVVLMRRGWWPVVEAEWWIPGPVTPETNGWRSFWTACRRWWTGTTIRVGDDEGTCSKCDAYVPRAGHQPWCATRLGRELSREGV